MKGGKMLLKHPSLRVPAKGAPALELFLSPSEKDILSILPGKESTCFWAFLLKSS